VTSEQQNGCAERIVGQSTPMNSTGLEAGWRAWCVSQDVRKEGLSNLERMPSCIGDASQPADRLGYLDDPVLIVLDV
jgi:hypothetical protein